jgi:hypothetical protein
MASPFQRQALHRKLIYGALILVLFTVAYVWRSKEFSVLGREIKGVDAQARDLSIREESRGEVDLLGAIVRLSTMGLRGVATCYEWTNAMEAQKKNQWNELELHVRTLTKLQPHFITPWIFQSWNLAYNVSVESDRISDKYFYIARGIGLLAQGEKQNRDNPDMRWSIGFFLQHKIGQSDETNTLRSLSQLSMIPPNERDPGRFWSVSEGRQEINLKELEDFCTEHPQLVRRLREGMRRERKSDQLRQFRCERADELVQFLEDNFRVPSLWEDSLPSAPGVWKPKQDKLKPLADRFPVLPPKHESSRPKQQPPDKTALNDESKLRDEDDAYQIARAWYSYAQEPLPKPGKLPGQSEPIENRVYQRLPRHMMTVIFRAHPAQAQRFTAERLQEEGWFDDSGWLIPDWLAGDRFSDGEPAVVGGGRKWGLEAWEKTRELWSRFGKDNHLLLDPAEQKNYEDRAIAFADKYHLLPKDTSRMTRAEILTKAMGGTIPSLREEDLDAETREEYFAWRFLRELSSTSHVCNFEYHYNRALVESKPETLQARKTFFEALDAQRLRNDEAGALQKYLSPTGMKAWRDKVLLTNKVFRRDSLIQEQTFEIQLRYMMLYAQQGGIPFKAQSASLVVLPMQTSFGAGICPVGLGSWLAPRAFRSDKDQPQRVDLDKDNPLLGGPFDITDEEGQPLIDQNARTQVLNRLFPALANPQTQGAPSGQSSSPPQQR